MEVKKYLKSQWCIIDKEGTEKIVFNSFQNPYLVEDSCIYSLDSNYFNIETGEKYCYSSTSMTAKDFIFLKNEFDDDKSKRGVMIINKNTGGVELFK